MNDKMHKFRVLLIIIETHQWYECVDYLCSAYNMDRLAAKDLYDKLLTLD